MRKILCLPGQFAPSRQLFVEPHTLAFEDIHAVAARLAARRLSDLQNHVADREARKLSQTVRAQRAEVKIQIQRIAFINAMIALGSTWQPKLTHVNWVLFTTSCRLLAPHWMRLRI